MSSSLRDKYNTEIRSILSKELNIPNSLAVPRLEKIVVSIGLGEAILNANALDKATQDLQAITGQYPLVTRAKKSISSFKLRQGMKIGLKVTLRHERMYTFLERLIQIALPRVRDFRGIPVLSFDGKGNYTLGLREQIVFPEINYESIDHIRGLQITLVTTARTDREALLLLRYLGMPFSE